MRLTAQEFQVFSNSLWSHLIQCFEDEFFVVIEVVFKFLSCSFENIFVSSIAAITAPRRKATIRLDTCMANEGERNLGDEMPPELCTDMVTGNVSKSRLKLA